VLQPQSETRPEEPKNTIHLTVWVLAIGEGSETPDDELRDNFADRVRKLPTRFESTEEVGELIGQLQVASMLRQAREFRMTSVDGQTARLQVGGSVPRIVATNVSPQPRLRSSRPRPSLDAQGPNVAPGGPTNDPPGQNEPVVTNSIVMEQIGTIVQIVPRVESNGSIHAQLTYESSDIQPTSEITLSEIPGRKPLTADKLVTHQVNATVHLKSGTAVLVQSDSSLDMTGDSLQSETKLLIFAASAEPKLD
jgi:hypothetical protein